MALQKCLSTSLNLRNQSLLPLFRLTNVRFSSKDEKQKQCTFKASAENPCSSKVSCRKEQRELNCHAISKNKPVCGTKKQTDFKPSTEPKKSVWETEPPFETCMDEFPRHPEICCPLCPYEVRLDVDLYYPKGLDRDFPQTWIECPVSMVPKEKCKSEQYELEYDYRPKHCKPKTATSCRNDDDIKCVKLNMAPCCRKGRDPPSCRLTRKPSDCKKACVPVPCYSECCLPEPYDMPTRGPQCYCLDRVPLCVVNREFAKQNSRK